MSRRFVADWGGTLRMHVKALAFSVRPSQEEVMTSGVTAPAGAVPSPDGAGAKFLENGNNQLAVP